MEIFVRVRVEVPFLIPYVIVHSAVLYSSRKLFGRTRRNNNGNDCEIKAAYVRDKTDSPARLCASLLPPPGPQLRTARASGRGRERRRNVFSFYTRDDHDTLALSPLFFSLSLSLSFFPALFFRNAPVNTFASTIDGIRRTLTVVNGETQNARY